MTCPGCGQLLTDSMDPVLADYWTTMDPVRCNACTALSVAHKQDEGREHPHALRHVVGMRQGWEEARSAARRQQATPDQ